DVAAGAVAVTGHDAELLGGGRLVEDAGRRVDLQARRRGGRGRVVARPLGDPLPQQGVLVAGGVEAAAAFVGRAGGPLAEHEAGVWLAGVGAAAELLAGEGEE